MKILTYKSSVESATLLAKTIERFSGVKIPVTQIPNNIKGPFIRYGCSSCVDVKDSEHNSASFIRLVANKDNFSHLVGKHGFYTPDFKNNVRGVTFPCLIRKTLDSYDGRGIIICKSRKDFEDNWGYGSFWTPFVRTTHELRAHVLGGEVVRIFAKVKEGREEEFPIRNLRLGYRYFLRDKEDFPGVQKLVNQLQPLINGSFYTLDLGWDAAKKKYFIFEANSGSGLGQRTAEYYADYLIKQLKIC